MALKWIDGFETFSSATLINRKYASGYVGESELETGRSSYGQAFKFGFKGTEFVTPDLGNHATWTIGFAFKNNMNADFTVLELRDGSTSQVELRFDGASTNLFRITRGSSTTLGTGTKVINDNTWYYVELKIVVNNSSGTAELRINETADIGPLTSQDTQQSASAQANRVAFKRTAVSASTQLFRPDTYSLDDIYICDGSGSSNTSFLGDMKVELVLPTEIGNSSQWTPDPANLDNYAAVMSDDENSVKTSTLNNKDTYVFTNLRQVSTSIAGIAVCVYCRNTDATNHTIKSVVRSGGSDTDHSTAQTISDISYSQKTFIHETDPNTATSWTASGINNAEFGMKLMS